MVGEREKTLICLTIKLTLQPNGNRLQTDLPNFSGYNSSAGAKLRSWGAPLWDQVIYGHDGVLTTHSSHPDNVKDFYETAHRYTHTLAVEGGRKRIIIAYRIREVKVIV